MSTVQEARQEKKREKKKSFCTRTSTRDTSVKPDGGLASLIMYPGHLSTNRLQRSQLGGNPLAHSQGGGGASFLATSANPPPPHVLRTNLPPAANPMATIVQQPAPEQPPIYTLPQPENPPISSGFVAVSDQPVDSNSNDDLLSEPALGGSQILQVRHGIHLFLLRATTHLITFYIAMRPYDKLYFTSLQAYISFATE
jgi:hypothetical protein